MTRSLRKRFGTAPVWSLVKYEHNIVTQIPFEQQQTIGSTLFEPPFSTLVTSWYNDIMISSSFIDVVCWLVAMFFRARFASHWLYLQKRLCNFFVSFASHAIHGQRPMLFSKPRRFPKQKQKQRPRPSVWVSSFSPKKICFLVGFLGAQITHTGRFRETTRCGRFSLSKRLL